jgi:hypothetical protein
MAASAPFGLQLFKETAAMAVMARADKNLFELGFIFERLIFIDWFIFLHHCYAGIPEPSWLHPL